MHEYAIVKSMVDLAVEEARKAGAYKITGINLVIGELSGVVDESVQMYFDIISEGTIASGAKLAFKAVHAKFRCSRCGRVFCREDDGYECSVCKSPGILTGAGREFYIESIEVEQEKSLEQEKNPEQEISPE